MNPREATSSRSSFHASLPLHGLRSLDLARALEAQPASLHSNPSDATFVQLQSAFRSTGGLARGDELALRLHVDGQGGYARLARWIVGRQVFSFAWHGDFWLPMFQFEGQDTSLHLGLRPVLAELATVMDGWAIASWFAEPNEALQGCSPVQAWQQHSPEVIQAARLQRFVMKG